MYNLFNFDAVENDYQYLISTMGQDILINEQPTRALITNTNLSKSYNDKKISSLSPIESGDIIYYNGKYFMIVSEQTGERYNKNKGIMRHLPFVLKVNRDCNYIDVPCYIDSATFGVAEGRIMTMAEGNIYVHTQDNEQTRQIKLNDRFIKYQQAFKVTGVDRLSEPGKLILSCAKDTISSSDDLTNDLAGGLACVKEPEQPTPQIHIVITGTDDSPDEIIQDRQKMYIAQAYDGDTLLTGEAVTWGLYDDDQVNSTTFASIVLQSDSECTVKNNNAINKYVWLKATLQSDSSVEGWIRIRLRSLI